MISKIRDPNPVAHQNIQLIGHGVKYVELKDIRLSNALCFKSMSRHPKISIVFSVNPSGMIHKIAERMISCQKEHRMYTESKQTHRAQQQEHSQLSRTEAEEEDS